MGKLKYRGQAIAEVLSGGQHTSPVTLVLVFGGSIWPLGPRWKFSVGMICTITVPGIDGHTRGQMYGFWAQEYYIDLRPPAVFSKNCRRGTPGPNLPNSQDKSSVFLPPVLRPYPAMTPVLPPGRIPPASFQRRVSWSIYRRMAIA